MKKTYIIPSLQVITLDAESCLMTTGSLQISNSEEEVITEDNFSTKILSTGSAWQSVDEDEE